MCGEAMTAPPVTNSSPTVDVATDPSQPVHDQSLRMIVERAQDQLRQLTLQRKEVAQKIALIKRTIRGLTLLCGADLLQRPENDAISARRRGITRACRIVLTRADTPLSAREVYAILQEQFPDLFRQPADCYASLVTILNRLAKYGEADTFLRNGRRFWQRHSQLIGDRLDFSAPRVAGSEINDGQQLASGHTTLSRGRTCL